MSNFRHHLDEHSLSLHAGGDLPRWRRWRAQRHVARCPICRAALADYVDMRGSLAHVRPVPQLDFGALAHTVRVAATRSKPLAAPQAKRYWPVTVGAVLAVAVLAALWLLPNSNDPGSDPWLDASGLPAPAAGLDPLPHADAQLTSAGSLRVQAFHAGSSTLTITDYYLP